MQPMHTTNLKKTKQPLELCLNTFSKKIDTTRLISIWTPKLCLIQPLTLVIYPGPRNKGMPPPSGSIWNRDKELLITMQHHNQWPANSNMDKDLAVSMEDRRIIRHQESTVLFLEVLSSILVSATTIIQVKEHHSPRVWASPLKRMARPTISITRVPSHTLTSSHLQTLKRTLLLQSKS